MATAAQHRLLTRTCQFTNLYYRPADRTFHYFATPTEAKVFEQEAAEMGFASAVNYAREQLVVAISPGAGLMHGDNGTAKAITRLGKVAWSPWLHLPFQQLGGSHPPPSAEYATIEPTAAIELWQPTYSFNHGHFMWDDVLPLFSMLDRFGMADPGIREEMAHVPQHIPLFVEYPLDGLSPSRTAARTRMARHDPYYRCSPAFEPRWSKSCLPAFSRWFEGLLGVQTGPDGDILRTGNWLQREGSLPHGAKYVLLTHVLVGSGHLGNAACEEDCAVGRGHLMRFRNFMLRNLLGQAALAQALSSRPRGLITFSVPFGSSRPSFQCEFGQLVPAVKELLGSRSDLVVVAAMRNLTLVQQARLALDSDVWVTNHGGGSATVQFLRRGAGAIIFTEKHRDGLRLDVALHESNGYYKVNWLSNSDCQKPLHFLAVVESELERISLDRKLHWKWT